MCHTTQYHKTQCHTTQYTNGRYANAAMARLYTVKRLKRATSQGGDADEINGHDRHTASCDEMVSCTQNPIFGAAVLRSATMLHYISPVSESCLDALVCITIYMTITTSTYVTACRCYSRSIRISFRVRIVFLVDIFGLKKNGRMVWNADF